MNARSGRRRRPVFIALLGLAMLVSGPAPVRAQELGERITINGYTNFEYEKQISKNGRGDKNGSFDADQFDLVFNVAVSERIRVAADLSWEHGTATEDGRGNQALEYGFVEYTFSDKFKLRFGKMFTPFGVFNEIHTAKPAFLSVKEAASLNKTERIVEGAFRFYPRWGAGLAAHGDVAVSGKDLSYDVLLSNGEQETTNPFEEDDNSSKAIAARVRYEPSSYLRIGYSFFTDRAGSSAEGSKLQSHGVEAEFTLNRVRVQAEFATGRVSHSVRPSVRQNAFYIQPSYHFDNGWTPYLRYEVIDQNSSSSDDSGRDFIAGINVEISKGFQFKAEVNAFKGGARTDLARYPGRGYTELKTALVLGF
jgi:hypothetical protein